MHAWHIHKRCQRLPGTQRQMLATPRLTGTVLRPACRQNCSQNIPKLCTRRHVPSRPGVSATSLPMHRQGHHTTARDGACIEAALRPASLQQRAAHNAAPCSDSSTQWARNILMQSRPTCRYTAYLHVTCRSTSYIPAAAEAHARLAALPACTGAKACSCNRQLHYCGREASCGLPFLQSFSCFSWLVAPWQRAVEECLPAGSACDAD
jgi:hypothetical protein